MRTQAVVLALAVLAAGCAVTQGPSPAPATSSSPSALPAATASPGTPTGPISSVAAPTAAVGTLEAQDSGGSATGGDIPDNAVFLNYNDASHGFSIVYVEGWQVTPSSAGVAIRDKDSSETVQIVPSVPNVATYIASTDLPQLQALLGFTLDTQDTVGVNGKQVDHIVYHAPSPPDPVTGKQVASTIDRYYVPGPAGQLAIVNLSTPDGVDNVDAFREMVKSFTWS